MSHEFNLATLAWAMTPSQKHTQTHSSPWCLRKPHMCFLLCPSIFHGHFILLACSFLSSQYLLFSSLSSTFRNFFEPCFSFSLCTSDTPLLSNLTFFSLMPTLSHSCHPKTIFLLITCQHSSIGCRWFVASSCCYLLILSSCFILPLWAS